VEPGTEKDPGDSSNNVMMEMRQKVCRCRMMRRHDLQGAPAQQVDHGALGMWRLCDSRVQLGCRADDVEIGDRAVK
jgi:hypothetical protein